MCRVDSLIVTLAGTSLVEKILLPLLSEFVLYLSTMSTGKSIVLLSFNTKHIFFCNYMDPERDGNTERGKGKFKRGTIKTATFTFLSCILFC